MLSAPISETLGRMGTYRIAFPLSALFTLGAGFSPNIGALCVLRFFAGFFGGAPLPVCAGTSADLFRQRDFAVAGSLLLFTPFLGTFIVSVWGLEDRKALGALPWGCVRQRFSHTN
jgi:MFS family permease